MPIAITAHPNELHSGAQCKVGAWTPMHAQISRVVMMIHFTVSIVCGLIGAFSHLTFGTILGATSGCELALGVNDPGSRPVSPYTCQRDFCDA